MVLAEDEVFSALSSSLPSVVRISTRPFLFLPVRPMRCTMRMGEETDSKNTMRSTLGRDKRWERRE